MLGDVGIRIAIMGQRMFAVAVIQYIIAPENAKKSIGNYIKKYAKPLGDMTFISSLTYSIQMSPMILFFQCSFVNGCKMLSE